MLCWRSRHDILESTAQSCVPHMIFTVLWIQNMEKGTAGDIFIGVPESIENVKTSTEKNCHTDAGRWWKYINMSILLYSNLCEIWYVYLQYLLLEENKYFLTFNFPGNSFLSIFSLRFLREQLESERHEIGVQYVHTWSPIIRIAFMVAMYANNI